MGMLKFDAIKFNKYVQKAGIKFAVLFGSRADGKAKEASDFDIAISFRNGKNIFEDLREYSKLLENFAEIFAVREDKIDLTDLNSANILLRREIARKSILLFGDIQDYEDFKAFSFRDYIDARPLFALEDKIIRRRQESIKKALSV